MLPGTSQCIAIRIDCLQAGSAPCCYGHRSKAYQGEQAGHCGQRSFWSVLQNGGDAGVVEVSRSHGIGTGHSSHVAQVTLNGDLQVKLELLACISMCAQSNRVPSGGVW